MVPHKRPELAVQIFAELARQFSDLSLVMVGSGLNDMPGFAVRFQEVLNALPVDARQRVKMFESISDSELRGLYERADLFLCTSAHEGYCLPLYEAMSFGLPVLSQAQDAVIETLGGVGLVLDSEMDSAVNQLVEVLQNPAKMESLQESALRRSEEIEKGAQGQRIWAALSRGLFPEK